MTGGLDETGSGRRRPPFPMGAQSWGELLILLARGYAQRLSQVLLIATGFFALDHVSKAIAALVPPDHYMLNDMAGLPIWAAMVPIFVVSLLDNRLLLIAGGLVVGGTMGNAVDAAFWPGGVPDFIDAPYPFTQPSIWNFADAFIDLGSIMFLTVLVVITVRRVAYETRAAQGFA